MVKIIYENKTSSLITEKTFNLYKKVLYREETLFAVLIIRTQLQCMK